MWPFFFCKLGTLVEQLQKIILKYLAHYQDYI
ncbi:hypothetical protein GALL_276660 [mine drainage metagenome]|uniref:Uncharacterized protein n=1 Tax=mine drainage metagenome TaxID=410659 RepID=A0A1J5R380_9ZZZZ